MLILVVTLVVCCCYSCCCCSCFVVTVVVTVVVTIKVKLRGELGRVRVRTSASEEPFAVRLIAHAVRVPIGRGCGRRSDADLARMRGQPLGCDRPQMRPPFGCG